MKSFSSRFSVGLLALLLLTLRLPAAAQAPAWQAAQAVAAATAASSSNYSTVTATAVDPAGNVFLTGTFTNSVILGTTTLTSLGLNDMFVAKFSTANNQVVWAQRAGGMGNDVSLALAISGTSVYVAGHFEGPTASFGSITLSNTGTGIISTDAFVAKLTDMGLTSSFTWAQQVGGTSSEGAAALAVSGTSVYVAGTFASPTVSFGTTTLTNTGFSDIFVAKLTDTGLTSSFTWAQRAGGTSGDEAVALALSGTSVYVSGYFYSSSAAFGAITLINLGLSDVFVAKLTDAGSTSSFVWAQRAGGTGFDYAVTLAVSGPSVYLAGTFASPTASFGTTTLTNAGYFDVFVTKLTDTGATSSFTWAQQAGGTSDDRATALAVGGGNIYVVGYFDSATIRIGSVSLTTAGTYDVFITRLTDAGNAGSFTSAQRAGGTGSDYANALVVSGATVYVAGSFSSLTADFGPTTLTNPNPSNNLGFLASLTDPTLTATTAAVGPREPATLFPNPARHTATLRLPAGTAPAPLVLTDALGRAVRRYPAPAGAEAALDLGGLPAGLYLLRGAGPAQRLVVE